MTNTFGTVGIMLEILSNYQWTRLSVRIIGAIKRQFFHMVTHVFDDSNLSNRHLESCNRLFGTWQQAHAYNPSDHMETRVKSFIRGCQFFSKSSIREWLDCNSLCTTHVIFTHELKFIH